MKYPGGKGQAGVYQRLINLMPPHQTYIETHLGGGNILEKKRPAHCSIGIDIDARVITDWTIHLAHINRPDIQLLCTDAAAFLSAYPWQGDELVYCDPPYVRATRRGGKIYRHEYTDRQHAALLATLRTIPAAVIISGYRCPLYDQHLAGWYRIDYQVTMRRGLKATESLWLNYDPPAALHDHSYLGATYRDRERIKRKQHRWLHRLAALSTPEQLAMLDILRGLDADRQATLLRPRAGARTPRPDPASPKTQIAAALQTGVTHTAPIRDRPPAPRPPINPTRAQLAAAHHVLTASYADGLPLDPRALALLTDTRSRHRLAPLEFCDPYPQD